MNNPFPHQDPEDLGEQETIDANQTDGAELGFSMASDRPSHLPTVPDALVAHPRYEVLQAIGQGGMGSVYKARHRLMNRLVAIKVIKPELVRNAKMVQRFQREVRAAAQLAHPNIVTAFDAEQVGELNLLVMEYVDGIDLAQLVKQQGNLPTPVACECIAQVAAGLQHAFENGMVHRDIKPQNLMLISDPLRRPLDTASNQSRLTIKILDFGLASFTMPDPTDQSEQDTEQSITAMGTFMGTPNYVAPEQAQDARQADIRSDVYSLGATLHFLLYGQSPREREKSKTSSVDQIETAASKDGQVPSSLRKTIERMMHPDPADRFQTPSDAIAALTPFIAAHRDPSSPSSQQTALETTRSSAWSSYLIWIAILLCSAIALSLLGGSWLSKLTTRESSNIASGGQRVHSSTTEPRVNKQKSRVNEVSKINVMRDSIVGQWRIESGHLLTPDYRRGLRAVLELPFKVPVEYDLTLGVARRSNANERFGGLNIAFPFGNSRGMLAVGTHRDVGGCFIERINGIATHESLPTWTEGFFFEIDESRMVVLKVRKHEVVVLIDGDEAIRWDGDPSQIDLPPGWEIPDRRSIFIGSTGDFAVEQIQFEPI